MTILHEKIEDRIDQLKASGAISNDLHIECLVHSENARINAEDTFREVIGGEIPENIYERQDFHGWYLGSLDGYPSDQVYEAFRQILEIA